MQGLKEVIKSSWFCEGHQHFIKYVGVIQRLVCQTSNLVMRVRFPLPTLLTCSSMVEHSAVNRDVMGSSPIKSVILNKIIRINTFINVVVFIMILYVNFEIVL